MLSFMDLAIAAVGIYILYIYYLMKFRGEFREGMLLPKGIRPDQCKDREGYIREMSGKVLFYGVVVLLCGIAGYLEDEFLLLGNAYLLVLVGFVACTVWFAIKSRNAIKKYW